LRPAVTHSVTTRTSTAHCFGPPRLGRRMCDDVWWFNQEK
jgi:hypothetical protein